MILSVPPSDEPRGPQTEIDARVKEESHTSALPEVQREARDEGPGLDHDEEPQTSHPRDLCYLWHQLFNIGTGKS